VIVWPNRIGHEGSSSVTPVEPTGQAIRTAKIITLILIASLPHFSSSVDVFPKYPVPLKLMCLRMLYQLKSASLNVLFSTSQVNLKLQQCEGRALKFSLDVPIVVQNEAYKTQPSLSNPHTCLYLYVIQCSRTQC